LSFLSVVIIKAYLRFYGPQSQMEPVVVGTQEELNAENGPAALPFDNHVLHTISENFLGNALGYWM
jgi:hypothetical protein